MDLPEQAHVQPLQVDPRQEGVDQHTGHVVEHKFGEIDARSGGETALVDTLEGQVGAGSDDGTATAQGGSVGSSHKVADCRFRGLQGSV